ncbi:MAG: Uma2 family endonuclease [Gemmatimonadales bacterium]|nr:Uma2 family endonuclease [Gemmatimonadales bacterium]
MVTLMTADELFLTSIPDKRTELVRGVLVVHEPAGYRHGRIATRLYEVLATYAKRTGAGEAFAAEIGFKLASDPDTVRAPDVGFITVGRLPDANTLGFPALGPDLVVEVLSPGDRPGETLAKLGDWLEGGTRLIWVIDPEQRNARVYRHDGTHAVISADQPLEGEEVLPGFTCVLSAVL